MAQQSGSRSSGSSRGQSRRRSGGSRRRFKRAPKRCAFCTEPGLEIDYKQPDVLRRFVFEQGKIRPRRQTGTCARHQRRLSIAIKRARHLALLPFVAEYPRSG